MDYILTKRNRSEKARKNAILTPFIVENHKSDEKFKVVEIAN